MRLHRAVNIGLALLIAAILSTSHLLDGPADFLAAQADALSRQDAIKTESAERRFERAAAAMCSENGGWRRVGADGVQCITKKGKRTGAVVEAKL